MWEALSNGIFKDLASQVFRRGQMGTESAGTYDVCALVSPLSRVCAGEPFVTVLETSTLGHAVWLGPRTQAWRRGCVPRQSGQTQAPCVGERRQLLSEHAK